MALVEFVGQSAQDREAKAANSSRLLNLYREGIAEGGNTRFLLKPVPGQSVVQTLSTPLLRAMAWVSGSVYTVAGGTLYEGGTSAVSKGSVKDSGETTIDGNNGLVTVCSEGRYYVLDGGVLSEPTAGAFDNFGSVAFLSNFTLLTERNGRRVQWSGAADPATLGGLDYATTEGADDNNIRGMALGGHYYVFKERSTELWYPTGDSNGAFAQIPGGIINTGLWGFNLVCLARDVFFFIGNDGVARLLRGQTPQKVSTRPVADAIKYNDPTHVFYVEEEDHQFCVIRFSDRPAWVFDIATGEWHERSEGAEHGPWGAVVSVQEGNGTWLVGGRDGTISRLTNDATDKGGTLYRRAVSKTLAMADNRFQTRKITFGGSFGETDAIEEADYGLDLADGLLALGGGYWRMGGHGGPEPRVTIRLSRDGGHTWKQPRTRGLGFQGEYWRRVVLRSRGQYRRLTIQIDMSEAYTVPFYSDATVELV